MPGTDKADKRTPHRNHMPTLRRTYANTPKKKGGKDIAMSKLPSRTRRRVKRQLSNERPTVWIGKNGISPELLQEVEKQLKKREMVKIKVLTSALEKKTEEIALEMTQQTLASLVEVRGHTFMLHKRRER